MKCWTIFTGLFMALTTTLLAQDLERVAPRSLDELGTPLADDAILVEALRGIVLLENSASVQSIPPLVEGVKSEGSVPPSVRSTAASFLGQSLSFTRVEAISQALVRAYRSEGVPVVDVVIPEQDITDGVVQFVVLVGQVGKIRVNGGEHFREDLTRRGVSVETGEKVDPAALAEDVRFLNRNPYRQVEVVYEPGETVGETDVVLETAERRPWTLYSGYENTGNEVIGEDRWLAGFEWGNVAGAGHILGYQYTTSAQLEGLQAHAGSYRMPLPRRSELRLIGGYVESEVDFLAGGERLHSGGESSQISGIYEIQLPRFGRLTHDLGIGYDFKSTNNNLEFGGQQVFDTTTEIHQFGLHYRGALRTSLGYTQLTSGLFYAPGGLSTSNEDAAFEESRFRASADYLFARAGMEHSATLGGDFRLAARLSGQVASENLLPSEQILFGGLHSVRGFSPNVARADRGLTGSVELSTPRILDHFRGYGFLDGGWGQEVNPLPNTSDLSLLSSGLGLDWQVTSMLSGRIAYGWQVAHSGFQNDASGRWHVGAMLRY